MISFEKVKLIYFRNNWGSIKRIGINDGGKNLRRIFMNDIPLLGIELGNQILHKSFGYEPLTYSVNTLSFLSEDSKECH